MKNLKRLSSIILALVMALSLTIPGCAASTSFIDVSADAWYKDAVDYVTAHELMNGTGSGRFSPGADTSRAMLVTILWRIAGEPVVNYQMQFTDVGVDWYTEAVRWVASEHIVDGYSDGRFGTNDPVSREQIVTIAWNSKSSGEMYSTTETL